MGVRKCRTVTMLPKRFPQRLQSEQQELVILFLVRIFRNGLDRFGGTGRRWIKSDL